VGVRSNAAAPQQFIKEFALFMPFDTFAGGMVADFDI
jgi:hypothetical protein